MKRATVEVRNPHGLHARPAALFVQAAGAYKSTTITVRNMTLDRPPLNAKSIISVLQAGVSKGHLIELSAEGGDEDGAIDRLVEFVESGAGEALEQQASDG